MCDFSKPVLNAAEPLGENWRIYRGNSMFRVFMPGDLLKVEKISARQVELGDIIAFSASRGDTVHRAVARTANGRLRTMGDNNPHPDAEPVPADAAVFRVVAVRRGDGGLREVVGGKAGMAEFRRNRRRRWWCGELPRYAAGICRRLWPFKRRLTSPVRFGDEEVFYVGDTPVVRRDADGRLRWTSPWYRVIYRID